MVPDRAVPEEVLGRPPAVHRLSLVQGPGPGQTLVIFRHQGLEAHSGILVEAVLEVGLAHRDLADVPAPLVPEISVPLALAPQPGQVEALLLHRADAVRHEGFHQTAAPPVGVGGHPADPGDPHRNLAHLPVDREHPHDGPDPPVLPDRVVAGHVLVGRTVQGRDQAGKIRRGVRAVHQVEEVYRLFEFAGAELDDGFGHTGDLQVGRESTD